jgi:hypothetical protein
MSRSSWLLLVGLWPAACRDTATPAQVPSRSALGPSDAALDADPLCAKVGYAGCCGPGQTLIYCVGGNAIQKSCPPAACGWDPQTSLYACGSSAGADPSGSLPRACPGSDSGALDLAAPDAPGDARLEAAGGCGPLGYAGCCAGSKLLYCVAGTVLHLECGSSGACGWNPTSALYDCGTAGAQDPSGVNPRACSTLFGDGGPQLDGAPDLGKDQGAVDQSVASADLGPVDASLGAEQPGNDLGPPRDGLPDTRRREVATGLDPSGLDRTGDRPGTVALISGGGGCSCELASPVRNCASTAEPPKEASKRNCPALVLVLSIVALSLSRRGSRRKG